MQSRRKAAGIAAEDDVAEPLPRDGKIHPETGLPLHPLGSGGHQSCRTDPQAAYRIRNYSVTAAMLAARGLGPSLTKFLIG